MVEGVVHHGPIYKSKGDVLGCGSFRPIRLISQTMKVFERIVERRLREILSLSPVQCGFVKGTTDAIFANGCKLLHHSGSHSRTVPPNFHSLILISWCQVSHFSRKILSTEVLFSLHDGSWVPPLRNKRNLYRIR